MKKVILAVAAIFAFGFANAQDKKASTGEGFANGDIFVSGAVGFGSVKTGDAKSSSFEIAPKIGLFVTDKIAIGAKLGYGSAKANNAAGVDTQDDATLTAGVFGRYYCTPTSGFSPFLNLGFDYMSTSHNLGTGYKTTGFDLALSPGVSYFLSSKLAMEASYGRLGYMSTKDDTTGAEATNSFGLQLDLRSITFGLLYKF